MPTASGLRKKNPAMTPPAPARTFGHGVISTVATAAFSLGRGGGSAAPPSSLGRGGGSAAAGTRPTTGGSNGAGTGPSSIDGFPFPPVAAGYSIDATSAWFDSAGGDPSCPASWDTYAHPPGGFMSYFGNRPHNFNFNQEGIHNSPMNTPLSTNNVATSTVDREVEISPSNGNVRTEKRIMWSIDEDVRVMSAWIEHSTDSTVGADRTGGQYWGDVVQSYNKTTPTLRQRNLKQCKDRWHKINRWTDLFECAYVKARRVFTSGYNDQMWIDAAHKFYLDDNKDIVPPLGPFVLMEVWKICRDVPKWKTYNEDLKNAQKRKTFHLEGDSQEDDQIPDKMQKRPMGQKIAKKAAMAAKGKLNGSSSSDDGQSKDSPIDLDKFDRYSKFQNENNEKRMKLLDRQEKISSEKLEATKIAHLTAQEYKEGKKLEKESKMMETYNNLISQDTSLMSNEEKAHRVAMMKCLMKALFPGTN